MAEQNGKSCTEWFRIITPFLLFVLTIFAGAIQTKLTDIDTKMFRHLTNDEMHSPRSLMVSKAEFCIYQEMRSTQMADIKTDLQDIKRILSERYTK